MRYTNNMEYKKYYIWNSRNKKKYEYGLNGTNKHYSINKPIKINDLLKIIDNLIKQEEMCQEVKK